VATLTDARLWICGDTLYAICDSQGRPLNLFVTAGQVGDYIGARALLNRLPTVDWLLL